MAGQCWRGREAGNVENDEQMDMNKYKRQLNGSSSEYLN